MRFLRTFQKCRAVAGFALLLLLPPAVASREKPPQRASAPVVVVATFYPNWPAEAVDRAITQRVARWVGQAPGVRRVESLSRAGISVIKVTLQPGTDPGRACKTISSLALAALPTLPPGCLPPVVLPADPAAATPLAVVEISDPARSLAQLTDMARTELLPRLKKVSGVIALSVLGGVERALVCSLDSARLAALNLSPRDVVAAIRLNEATLKFAVRYVSPSRVELTAEGTRDTIKKLEELPLNRKQEGGELLLRDVARVTPGQLAPTALVRVDGRRTVCVPLHVQRGADAHAALTAAEKALAAIQKKLPKETRLRLLPLAGPAPGGLLKLHVRVPSKLRLAATEKRVAQIERAVKIAIPARERTLLLTEVGLDPDWTAIYSENAGEHDATLWVRLTAKRPTRVREYAAQLRRLLREDRRFADLSIAIDSGDAPIEVRITGGTQQQALKLASEVRQLVSRVKGTVDVRLMERQDGPMLILEVDGKKTAELGLSAREVAGQAVAAFGSPVPVDRNLWIADGGGTAFRVMVPFPEGSTKRLDEALNTPVTGTRMAAPVRLGSLVKAVRAMTPVEIRRIDGDRVFTIRVGAEGRDVADVARDVAKALEKLTVPRGMRVKVGPPFE